MADAKHAVLTLVKIKHGAPETRLNPCLIYLSRLEEMHVELTGEHMEAHSSTGRSYLSCTKSSMMLRCDVSKSDPLPHEMVQNLKKNPRHAKSSKMTIFRAGSGVAMFTLATR